MSRLASTSMPNRRTSWNRSTTSTLWQEPRRYAAVASRLSSTSVTTSSTRRRGREISLPTSRSWQTRRTPSGSSSICTFVPLCKVGVINVDLCNGFCEYLLTAPQGLHKNRKQHINSTTNYWSTFRASIHTAYRDHKIKENPNDFLERIETIPTDKEHLSQDERVIRLASTESRDTVLFTLPT